MKTVLKKPEVRTQFMARFTSEEKEAAQKNADLYAEGNLAAWIRYAAMNCVPRAKDLQKT